MRLSGGGFVLILVLGVLFVPLLSAGAEQRKNIPRIGYLGRVAAFREAFQQGLQEHGYVVGENVMIETGSAHGKRGRLSAWTKLNS